MEYGDSAKRDIATLTLSVCRSVCQSVKLRYCRHIGSITSKVITRIISLHSSLFGAQGRQFSSKEHTQIFMTIPVN